MTDEELLDAWLSVLESVTDTIGSFDWTRMTQEGPWDLLGNHNDRWRACVEASFRGLEIHTGVPAAECRTRLTPFIIAARNEAEGAPSLRQALQDLWVEVQPRGGGTTDGLYRVFSLRELFQ